MLRSGLLARRAALSLALLVLSSGSAVAGAMYEVIDLGPYQGGAVPGLDPKDGLAGTTEQGRPVGLLETAAVDLGELRRGFEPTVKAVNDAGQAAGGVRTNGGMDAFLVDPDGRMQLLGALAGGGWSMALGLDDDGRVVGYSDGEGRAGKFASHAFIGDPDGLHDLNDLIPPASGWELRSAFAIDDDGRIVGEGDLDGERHAFLLRTQALDAPNPVPEPAPIALALAGLAFALARRRAGR